jgi:hypothetical protein
MVSAGPREETTSWPKRILIGVAVVVLVVEPLAGARVVREMREQLRIESCLDHGGRIAADGCCDGERPEEMTDHSKCH